MNAINPLPAATVTVRDATLADVAFIDGLQKLHREGLGFMATSWIEGKIAKNEIIIAEDGAGERVGYCMGVDRYFKRDDVGIIHQMNVVPGRQRSFVAATLLKAMFDRAAYGCRLFCCWCAQDLPANKFWEAMGFVPLAYRGGSEKKSRVHIFWQKRIRQDDVTTPWWFPAKTDAGSLRADRIVLPIPAGKHWSDEMPVIHIEGAEDVKALPGERVSRKRAPMDPPPVKGSGKIRARQFGGPAAGSEPVVEASVEKPKREKKPKAKADPKLIAAAREFRDRWLEQVNAGEMLLEGAGKYDIARALPDQSAIRNPQSEIKLLPAA